MTNLQQEQIDQYHSGLMNESEKASFEKQLEADPALKAESDLQSDIINGLKEYRKIELKSRLDAINVGPTWMEFVGQSTLMKSMGGVIVASVIGTGIYFLGDKNEAVETTTQVEVDAPVTESIEYVWNLGAEKEEVSNKELEKPQINQKAVIAEKVEETVVSRPPSSTEELANVDQNETFKPSFEAPTVDDVTEETKFEATGLDELPETTETVAKEDPIDVETEISKSSTIKYKYYDGKLFLNGDFDKAPYEILEINSASGRRIYVYYLGTYYKVGITDRLTELPVVKDQDVINELQLIRENK
ncbi:hypothetical protein [Ekhidna sp.]|uniref:hypothetical protein n=1 Tax=Ekhidna sp. TaxID=2608089 RepID=UPI003CCBDC32